MDYLVVGSGLAGLSFGALSAVAGHRVRVLEAHDAFGGFGHTFEQAGKYRFNAQLHYVWNCGPGQTVHRILSRLGLAESVRFERLDPQGFDRMRMPGRALDIPASYSELERRLVDLFPGHARALSTFLAEVRRTTVELGRVANARSPIDRAALLVRTRRLVRYRKATLQDVFDSTRVPPEAQTLLALQWPDFLLPPERLSFFAWVLLFDGYMSGAWYPTRHFEHVVSSLVRVIREHGGEVLGNRVVTDFVLERGAVVGVIAEDPTRPGHTEEHRAGNVICNMDPRRAAEMIGLERFSTRVRRKLDYEYSPSNFVAYLVVRDLDLREYGFGRSNLFHTEQVDLNTCFRDMYHLGDYSKPSFAVTTPSLMTDHRGDCPDDCQIVELLTVADYQRFLDTRLRDPRAYRRKKKEVLDVMLDIIERDYVPGFREHLVFRMTGSPTTNERFCRAPRGNSYGSTMSPEAMGPGRLGYESSLDRFYFCNASSGYAGFAGTFWTGLRLYRALSGDRTL